MLERMRTETRPLNPLEIELWVKPDYDSTSNPLPDPKISVFLGVVRDEEVLAYLCLQLKLHAQPLRIYPGHQALFPSLIRYAEEYILEKTGPQWVYLFCPDDLLRMASAMGMDQEPWKILSKFVGAPESVPAGRRE